MFVKRRTVMNALFQLLQDKNTAKLIKTFSRRFVTPEQISGSAAMPFLCLCKPKESYPPRAISSLPATRTFYPDMTIWLQNGQNQQGIPDDACEDIMDYLDEALAPGPYDKGRSTTLGGLVDFCNIEGEVSIVPGDLDGSGMIYVPLKIVLP